MSRLSIRSAAVTALTALAIIAGSTGAGIAPAEAGRLAPGGPTAQQDDADAAEIVLVTVVGCLAQEPGDLPWILDRATDGEPAEQAFTSEAEIARSAAAALGDLRYRLLGVGEFGVEPHAGHRVQVKGLKLRYEGEWRLNVTSFQHLAPACE